MGHETEPKVTSDTEDTECWIAAGGGVGPVGRSGMSSNSGQPSQRNRRTSKGTSRVGKLRTGN
jgi:hypothetical protein